MEPPAVSSDLFPSASIKGTHGTAPPEEKDRSDHEVCASLDSDTFWSRAGEPGVLEGVHPGLATYESQRAASARATGVGAHGADGRGIGAWAEDYALMLDQMQVCDVPDDASRYGFTSRVALVFTVIRSGRKGCTPALLSFCRCVRYFWVSWETSEFLGVVSKNSVFEAVDRSIL